MPTTVRDMVRAAEISADIIRDLRATLEEERSHLRHAYRLIENLEAKNVRQTLRAERAEATKIERKRRR